MCAISSKALAYCERLNGFSPPRRNQNICKTKFDTEECFLGVEK